MLSLRRLKNSSASRDAGGCRPSCCKKCPKWAKTPLGVVALLLTVVCFGLTIALLVAEYRPAVAAPDRDIAERLESIRDQLVLQRQLCIDHPTLCSVENPGDDDNSGHLM